MAELAGFRGKVRCLRSQSEPALTLSGASASPPGEPFLLGFSGSAPEDLPDTLEDVRIEQLQEGSYRIVSGQRAWVIEARALHLHRDVGAAFYRALPPRRAPWHRRLFFWVVLQLARSHRGMAALRRLRR
jgi:hypothetical protein